MSLVRFQSPTQGSVIMFGQDAQTLLDTLGLPVHGEMTAGQLPDLLQRLKTAIDADKAANPVIWPEDLDVPEDMDAPIIVHFAQRAAAMVSLMERCIKSGETILW